MQLRFDEPIQKTVVNIEYEAYHNMLYSNYQAVHLPGYFPWYPMAGKKEVYFQNAEISNMSYGLNPYNKVDEALFRINVDAQYPVVCNLNQKDKQYIGKSDSLTLIGGHINLCQENQYDVVNYFPYVISPYSPLEDELKWNDKEITSLKESFQRIFGVELNSFHNKKIFIMPKSVIQTQVMGGYAEFNDYILLSYNSPIDCNFLNYHLFNRFDLDPYFIDALLNSKFNRAETKDEYFQSILETINMNIQNIEMYSHEDNQDAKKHLKKNKELKAYFENEIMVQGLDETLNEIGQILLGEDYEY